ncbi:ligase-associated DNA damage response exonuclease [Marinigracilibium pacificum]|uniref:Ligase-associated DNA damage response exonuclease n=1 Tax=Marinigracilibium pacificum TaxID=2729599 RepID=A0A848IZ09_9BACT|nr:ligase-associated DNA damage response exonuclease [Marinigracilibium pacificum]NMM47454.1 ligase-associated DNA damage response exonuclease [Marinigracilibium pacificum]
MRPKNPLLTFTDKGIYCEKGDFFIDPWRPVDKALITHGHADHARWGMKSYLSTPTTELIMKHRIGADINSESISYGEKLKIGGVNVTYFPAGHIPGSAQILVEDKQQRWIVSGDYKVTDDSISEPFELVKCDYFITESTFGLPVYQWRSDEEVFEDLNQWIAQNSDEGVNSVILGYSLGKAQRLLQGVDKSFLPVYCHGAVFNMNEALVNVGMKLQEYHAITKESPKDKLIGKVIIAPPSVLGSSWLRQLTPYRTAMASGWMTLRGARRRRNADKGIILSDHVDWPGLNETVKAVEAKHIYVTHGYSDIYVQYLREQGIDADVVKSEYEGETDSE